MMDFTKKYLIFLSLIILSFVGVQAQSNINAVKAKAEQLSGDRFAYIARTAKGAVVYGVKQPSTAMKNAIDRGLSDLFVVARKNGYRAKMNYSDYIIFICKADRETDSDGNYIPNFAIPVRQYAGTDYDKGGYMYAGGMVISNSPLAFMIADNTKKLSQVSDVVRYEGEHLVLYHNDRKRYNQTADHSKGGGHPILQ